MTKFRILSLTLIVALFGVVLGVQQFSGTAAPQSKETQYRAVAIDENSSVRNVVLLDGPVTGSDTTPVAGESVCLSGDADLYAARLTLTGTLAGTAPVLTVQLQSSDDGGTTWTQVGSSFAAINATTTPTAGKERVTFADSASGGINTPVAYGNCFRVQYTWGGTGDLSGDVSVSLYAE